MDYQDIIVVVITVVLIVPVLFMFLSFFVVLVLDIFAHKKLSTHEDLLDKRRYQDIDKYTKIHGIRPVFEWSFHRYERHKKVLGINLRL